MLVRTVLPEPLRPMMATVSPGKHVQVHSFKHHEVSEGLMDSPEGNQRRIGLRGRQHPPPGLSKARGGV